MTTPIYKPLQYYFIAQCLAIAANLLSNSEISLYGEGLISGLLNLAALVLQLLALASLRSLSDHLRRAFWYTVISLCGSVLSLLFAVGTLLSMPQSTGAIAFLLLLVTIVFLVVSFLASYHFYWGLDDLIPIHGYDFPRGRLHWAFYWELIGILSFSGHLILTLLTFAIDLAPLIIFYPFVQAVKRQEGL